MRLLRRSMRSTVRFTRTDSTSATHSSSSMSASASRSARSAQRGCSSSSRIARADAGPVAFAESSSDVSDGRLSGIAARTSASMPTSPSRLSSSRSALSRVPSRASAALSAIA